MFNQEKYIKSIISSKVGVVRNEKTVNIVSTIVERFNMIPSQGQNVGLSTGVEFLLDDVKVEFFISQTGSVTAMIPEIGKFMYDAERGRCLIMETTGGIYTVAVTEQKLNSIDVKHYSEDTMDEADKYPVDFEESCAPDNRVSIEKENDVSSVITALFDVASEQREQDKKLCR